MTRAGLLALVLVVGCGDPGPSLMCEDCGELPPCDSGECGPSGNPGCEVAASTGPKGALAGYALGRAGTRWLLVREPAGTQTTLWKHAGDAWTEVVLDRPCRNGVLALDAQDRAVVACAVPSEEVADYDVQMFVVGAQSLTWRTVAPAARLDIGTRGGLPVSVVYDAFGRASVLWQQTYRGEIDIWNGNYYLSQDLGTGWSSQYILPFAPGGYDRNVGARLMWRDTELMLTYKDGAAKSLVISRIDGTRTETVATIDPTTVRAFDFAADYEIAPDPHDDTAWHVVLTDPSVYDDLPEPGYVAYHHVKGHAAGDRKYIDGPAPIHDRSAGLAGLSFAFDSSGAPVTSYDAAGGSALRLARPDGLAWDLVDLAQGDVGDSVIRFDDEGQMHVAFEDIERGLIQLLDERCE